MCLRKPLLLLSLAILFALPAAFGGCAAGVGDGGPLPFPDPGDIGQSPEDPPNEDPAGEAPDDGEDPLANLRPRRLRLIARPVGGQFELLWDAPVDAANVASYAVYAAGGPFEDGADAAELAATDSGETETLVVIAPDSGLVHLRVAARDADGTDLVLSEPLIVDTETRLLFLARKNREDTTEAFLGRLADVEPLCVSGSLVPFSDIVAALWSPDGRKLALVSDRDRLGSLALHVVDPDGRSEPVKVSGATGALGMIIGAVSWSPDGKQIVFSSNRESPSSVNTFVTSTEAGAEPRRIDEGFPVGRATIALKWLRDGRRVLLAVDESGDGAIDTLRIVNVEDGSSVEAARAIRTDENFDVTPGLSPDESMLAFLSDRRQEGIDELYVVPVDGSEPPLRISGALEGQGRVQQANWSPSANMLAFNKSNVEDRNPELFVINADNPLEPVKVSGAPPKNFGVRDFAWSPDGSRLAFLGDKEVSTNDELFVTKLDGLEEPVKRSGDPRIGRGLRGFAWSPDGTRLGFLAEVDSSNTHILFTATADGPVDRRPVSGEVVEGGDVSLIDFDWSPGGALVAFSGDKLVDGRREQFVVKRDGGVEPTRVNGGLVSGGEVLFGSAVWSPFSQ